jgi:hypothetical protein
MSINAFNPQGNTVVFTAATTAPTAVQAVGIGLGCSTYEVMNPGNVTVFLGFATDAANAATNATVVTSTGKGYPVLPGTDKIIGAPPNAYFSGITASGTATVYITPGEGL